MSIERDIIYFSKRKGTIADPYIDITENVYVHYGKVFLKEIPLEAYKVTVYNANNSAMTEVYTQSELNTTNVFYVNYRTGVVYFNGFNDGLLKRLVYRGEGVILYPASRVYTSVNEDTGVVETLQQLVSTGSNLKPMGAYSSATNYMVGNIVSYNGASYMAKASSQNVVPTNTTNWQIISMRGEQGIQGIQGVQGETGDTGTIDNVWKGAYSAGTAYPINSLVSYNGNTYLSKQATTGNLPTNTTYWSLFTSKGTDGANGSSLYTWIKYADTPTTGISDLPAGKDYMGVAVNKTSATESNVYSDYQWIYIRGQQGIQGIQGETGATGTIGNVWQGVYNASTAYPINSLVSYNGSTYLSKQSTTGNVPTNTTYWDLFTQKGTDGTNGTNGTDGLDGADGATNYLWIKYADSPTTGMSDSPIDKNYIGFAENKTTQTASANYADYKWTLIRYNNVLLSEYDNTATYEVGTLIRYNNEAYMALAQTTGNLPTDTNFWGTMAGGGDTTALETRVTKAENALASRVVNVKHPPAGLTAPVGDGVADDTVAIQAIIAYMNTTYATQETLMSDARLRGTLIFPVGRYKITDTLVFQGNYNITMEGVMHYTGVTGKTFMKIGYDDKNIFDCTYRLNAYTTVAEVPIGIELINLGCCEIQTDKIRGFMDGIRCISKNFYGYLGNVHRFGHFNANRVDLHLTQETNGWTNANRFHDGFFYKQVNTAYEQNCVKMSSLDGTYLPMDSNLFDGHNFEEGKPNTIPIKFETGEFNRFTNIRNEMTSDTTFAIFNRRGNTVDIRSNFSASTKVISQGNQHTYMRPLKEMKRIWTSGDLGKKSIQTIDNRIYNPNITFRDSSSSTYSRTLSRVNDPNIIALVPQGIQFTSARAQLAVRFKVDGDRYFNFDLSVFDKTKHINTAISCFDDNMVKLPLTDATINTGDWLYDGYVKSDSNLALYRNADYPFVGSWSYRTPISTIREGFAFEVHPNVKYIEIYVGWGWNVDNNDVIVQSFGLSSGEGRARFIDPATDREEYTVVRGKVYTQQVVSDGLNLVEVGGTATGSTTSTSIEPRTTDPASPTSGRIWLRTDL